ncbi:hypothetical protein [Paraburkholderia dilworthii]|uniref:hypothetical protein n=1 Tax=Paraburkholderia dilworthii TaxID=948106 RepID=UPI0004079CED|nr:hypothetical protein [Paraburkholderia dilworthii]
MNLHHRDQFQKAQWAAYQKRMANRSLFDRVIGSPLTFYVAVAGLVACVVAALLAAMGVI